jgi:bifunctional non-homologous end joining protein LigD
MPKALSEYRRKRDFSRTTEPKGTAAAAQENRFVVHKHSATADHYDLRLQVGDVLKCWAVPKGPSVNPADKRLAVETEDHPADYADFEGVIPEGQYGAGPMIIWDEGSWAPMGDISESLRKGEFKFRLVGKKLQGGWMLARLKPRPSERQNNWLLIKEQDFAADPDRDILAELPQSVRTGRRIEEMAVDPSPLASGPLRPGSLKGAVRAPFPERLEPQLAVPENRPPDGDGWLHEIKFDGYRTLAHIENGKAVLRTRSGLDWTRKYGDLADAFVKLPCKSAVIDGEIVVLDEKGASSFERLQEAIKTGSATAFVFFAFDLLYLNGWDLRKVPLSQRKAHLARLLAGNVGRNTALQFSDHVAGKGMSFFERVSDMNLEGVVSKRENAPYRSGRDASWIKAKAQKAGTYQIAGYTTSKAAGGLAALALGEWVDDELRYRGKVGTGFDRATADSLLKRLQAMDAAPAPEGAPKEVIGVKPVLSANIYYTGLTPGGALRHPVFKGLRELHLTQAEEGDRKRLITDADLAGVWVTNPNRRLFGKAGPTKLEIATYYASVGDFMLPHILGRPVSLVRCPTGKAEDCFFQRHPFAGMPDTIATFRTKSEDGSAQYIALEDAKSYLALPQFGVVEIHAWGSHRKHLEKPDWIIFDLDPGEGVQWREIVEAALHVRGELTRRGLEPFAKTTGGKGIHVVVPIKPKSTWKTVHSATERVANEILATAPDVFVTNMAKRLRKGRIFIDYHRNARSATAAAPYTLRARPNLPVSTPVGWSDLELVDGPEDFNYISVPKLLGRSGDPWAKLQESARSFPV